MRLLSAFMLVQRFQLAAVASSVAMATERRKIVQKLILLCEFLELRAASAAGNRQINEGKRAVSNSRFKVLSFRTNQ